MWETVSKVKNLAGLAALALAIAYLLSDKLIEAEVISGGFGAAMLLGFLVVFVFGVMILAIVGKVKEGGSSKAKVVIKGNNNEVSQASGGGADGPQTRKANAEIEGDGNKVTQAGE